MKTSANTSATLSASALAALHVLVPVSSAEAQEGHMQHGNPAHGGSHAMGMAAMKTLQGLKGKPFDVAFLSQMIAHHQGALTMSRYALPTLKDKHVREHAQNIVASQAKEIAEMNALLQ